MNTACSFCHGLFVCICVFNLEECLDDNQSSPIKIFMRHPKICVGVLSIMKKKCVHYLEKYSSSPLNALNVISAKLSFCLVDQSALKLP